MQLLLRREIATTRIVTALRPIRNGFLNRTVSTESLGAQMPPALCYFHREIKTDPLNTRNSTTRTRTASVGPNKRGPPESSPDNCWLEKRTHTSACLLHLLTDNRAIRLIHFAPPNPPCCLRQQPQGSGYYLFASFLFCSRKEVAPVG